MLKMRNNKEEKNLEEVFKEFEQYCKIKNLSDATIQFYQDCFSSLTMFIPSDEAISNINLNKIYDYIMFLRNEREVTEKSINTYLRGNRAFLYFAMERGYLKEFKIEMIKTEKTVKTIYTDNELKLLLKKPDIDKCNFSHYRNWVIINFLLGTGCRASTLVNIKVEDLNLDDEEVLFKTVKNRIQQVIPLTRSLQKILIEYLSYRNGDPSDYLFCNIYSGKLTVSGLNTAIRRYNGRRGVDKTSIHLFRHTFAKKWIINGGDPFRLKKILGHKSIKIVQEYVYMYSDDLKKDFSSFNPLEEFNDNRDRITL